MLAEDLNEVTFRCVTFLDAAQAALIDAAIDRTDSHLVTVAGADLLTHTKLLATLGRAFAFPDYYGQNYNALDECLRDLSWLPAPGYVLRVRDADSLWRQSPRVAAALVETWLLCAEHWASLDEPVPFHLLFLWGAETAAAARQDYPLAAHLLGGYYHQDWDFDDPDPDTAVGRFLADGGLSTPSALVAELERLRAGLAPLSEEAALEFLFTDLSCCYDPSASDLTVDTWLAHLQHLAARA